MKILFVENRYRTVIWRLMADALRSAGHEVKFIIQNRTFHHKQDEEYDYLIPYPRKDSHDSTDPRNSELIMSDRNINYFRHVGSSHYDYYRERISGILEDYKPNVVFGESTAFHELITIDICKAKGIMYLHPNTCRYPVGRFSFYKYNTLEPFGGSDEALPKDKAINIIKSITERTTVPDYMKKRRVTFASRWARIKELLELSASYYKGEHYNTPSPFVKRRIEKKRNELVDRWNEVAIKKDEKDKKAGYTYILYPMHMQPEANLDVWGRKYRDQVATIRKIVETVPDDVRVIVKPNPKSKYELTDSLLDLVEKEPKIIPVHHDIPMGEVLKSIDMVITVTGTIAIECILSNLPVVTLVDTLNNRCGNCIFIDSIDKIGEYIAMVQKGKFPKISEEEKCDFLNLLNKTSYKGIPYIANMDPSNIEECQKAFLNVLQKI